MHTREYRVGWFTLQPFRQLSESGDSVSVKPKALAILSVLAEAEGALVTKDELMVAVWPNLIVEDKIPEARTLFVRALELARMCARVELELTVKTALAAICRQYGEFERAEHLYRDVETTCRQLGDVYQLETCLGNRAVVALLQGNPPLALRLLFEQEKLCRAHSLKEGLMRSLGNQAGIYHKLKNDDRALELHREEIKLARELADPNALSISIGNVANVHEARGHMETALQLLMEQEQVALSIGTNTENLRKGYINQARVRRRMGDSAGADKLYERVLDLFEELDPKERLPGLQELTDNLAREAGMEWSMRGLRALERAAAAAGDPATEAIAFANQAYIYLRQEKPAAAVTAITRAMEVCRQFGLTDVAKRIEPIAAALRQRGFRF